MAADLPADLSAVLQQGEAITGNPPGFDLALALLARERMSGETSPQAAQRILDMWRGTLGPAADAAEVAPEVARIRAAAGLPVVVGFGISTPDAAQAVASVADGCVVGRAIVKQIGEGRPVSEVLDFVADLARGAHGG